jgi:hypothetical protein
MAKFIVAALIAACVAGCGGGSGASPFEPTPPAQSSCQPVTTVKLQFFGDSTVGGAGAVATSPAGDLIHAPTTAVQTAMDARFGKGAVLVYNNSSMGTSSVDLINGTDGINQPWPKPVLGDIVVVGHGVVDEVRHTPLQAFQDNEVDFASIGVPVVLLTPPPTYRDWEDPAYAQAVRNAAAQTHAVLADVHSYMAGLPNPAQYSNDQVHPNDVGYQLIVDNVLMPALVPLVAKLKCQAN